MSNLSVIELERPDSPDAVALITELEEHLAPQYPAASRHGYSVEKLIGQGVHFFVMRYEGAPVGCGGVQFFGQEYGEIKRMYVRPSFRGMGLAKLLVTHLATHTQTQGISLLRLETGIYQTEAIALYEKMGFRRVKPFGDYRETDVSLCYEKIL